MEDEENGEGKYLEKENVTIAGKEGTNEQGKIGLLSQWTIEG